MNRLLLFFFSLSNDEIISPSNWTSSFCFQFFLKNGDKKDRPNSGIIVLLLLTFSLQLVGKESSFFISEHSSVGNYKTHGIITANTNNEWTIVPDRMDATYEIGETANFIITSTVGGNISYSIFYDERTPVLSSGTLNVPINTPVSIPFTLNESGVVLCKVTMNGTSKLAAVTFSPFDIPILEEAPTDFDAFWQTAKAQLSAIPLDPRLTVLSNNNHSTSYRIIKFIISSPF